MCWYIGLLLAHNFSLVGKNTGTALILTSDLLICFHLLNTSAGVDLRRGREMKVSAAFCWRARDEWREIYYLRTAMKLWLWAAIRPRAKAIILVLQTQSDRVISCLIGVLLKMLTVIPSTGVTFFFPQAFFWWLLFSSRFRNCKFGQIGSRHNWAP